MAKSNTKPLSGMRDFLPLDVLRRNYMINIIEEVYQSYGFEPLETPVMERLDTLLGKYGEDEKLIFRVMKRGDKLQKSLDNAPTEESIGDAGLRYDLTVPLARVVAEYRSQLPRIFKRYQIQPVYRADRPAKGRYREFYQCDVDIVGSASQTVEAEVIAAAAQVLINLGFMDENAFAIRLNHRGVLRGLMEISGIPTEQEGTALTAIDKLDKIGLDGVAKELSKRDIDDEAAAKLINAMSQTPNGCDYAATLGWMSELLEESEVGSNGVAELRNVVAYSQHGPAADRLHVDAFLARGLSYYTGSVFEIDFPELGVSGGGGGRYDQLIGMFSGQDIPACGFSLGFERILMLMEEQQLFPEKLMGQPQVLMTQFSEETVGATLGLAQRLRDAGIRVDVYPDPGRTGRQLQYGEERRIRYAIIMGPDEIEKKLVQIKDLQNGEQLELSISELENWLALRI